MTPFKFSYTISFDKVIEFFKKLFKKRRRKQ